MASLFRARRQVAESGSGGKILHERLRDQPPRPSPYARSPPLALPPPPPGSPRWFLGLVSGAGKLISSVFRADSSSPDSSDYSSDHDRSSSRSDEQNIDAPKQLHGSSRELTKSEEIADCMEVSHTIVPVSETKLAIEKLLQQETFSRDECERLTKLLQSRVADSPSVFVQDKVGEAISNGLPGNAVEFSGAWLSLQQCNVLPGSDVRDDASPVYLAKSYMQSLSPQQSPSDGSITLSSMIASKEDLLTDSSNHARTSNSLSSIKESPDNNKRPHLILADTLLENPSSKLIDSQELFQTETSKISPAADERDPYFLRTVQFSSSQSSLEASNAPAKSLVEHVEDLCHNDDGNLVDKPINEDLAVKSTSATLTSEPMETLTALVEKIASPTISSLGLTPTDTPTEHKLPSYLDANKDVVKASPTVIIIDDDVPHESFISASASKVPDDAKDAADGSGHEFSKNGGSPESNVIPQLVSQENKSFTQFSNGEQTTDVAKVIEEHPSRENHITTKSQKVMKRKSIEQISVSPRPRTRQQAKREDAKDAADGSGHEFSKNGGSPESNVNPQLVSHENKSFTQFSNGEQTTDVAKVIEEHPSMDPAHRENHVTTKSQKVTKRKSLEHISVSPRPRTRQAAKREDVKDAADGSGHEFSKNGGSPESNVNPQSFTQFSNGEQTTDVAKAIEEHPSMDPAHRENHITTKSQKVTKRKSLEHISVSPRPRTRQQAKREGKMGHREG